MMRAGVIALLLGASLPAAAQETIVIEPLAPVEELLEEIAPPGESAEDAESTLPQVPTGNGEAAESASGGVVRVLDKISGQVTDLELRAGDSGEVGPLTVTLLDCRYPVANPAGDAYVLLTIRHRSPEPVFEGWMIASSPAVSAMDHPRYDVWALRCTMP